MIALLLWLLTSSPMAAGLAMLMSLLFFLITTVIATPWLTLAEAAKYARCSEPTIRREARAGRLKAYKLASRKCWRFRREDIDEWMMGAATPVPFAPRVGRAS